MLYFIKCQHDIWRSEREDKGSLHDTYEKWKKCSPHWCSNFTLCASTKKKIFKIFNYPNDASEFLSRILIQMLQRRMELFYVISFYLCTFRSFAVSVPILFDIVYFYFVIDCKLNEDKKYVCSFQNILENCFSRLFNFYTHSLCPLQFCFNNYLHYGVATNSFK